eukprot:m.132196 g.132196  ORF g.132196 m.132196 type:complete len:297 (+) comp13788_c0_seq2:4130-5020(+)
MGNCLTCCQACCCGPGDSDSYPGGGYGQSKELRAILVGGGDAQGSPPPSLNLATVKARTELDGQVWAELIRAGFVCLYHNKELCNKINVFPVPDGDTGTNMVITLRNAVKAIGTDPDSDVVKMMQTIAGQAALNAQGNSGTIFSFTFTKLSAAVAAKSKPSLAIAELAECLKEVAAGMTEAMSNPFPGTMLSVITDTFNAASASDVKDVETLVIALLNAGKASLLKTPDQLVVNGKKILKDRGVVDSGAQGFVLLLQGMADAIAGTLEYGEYLEVGTGWQNISDVNTVQSCTQLRT